MTAPVTITRYDGIRTLYHSGVFWMNDCQAHRESMQALAAAAFGDVLVAGYGLGLVQRALLDNPRVSSVLTVEINPEVIAAMTREDGRIWGGVEIADFYQWESGGRRFDCVIGDTWADCTAEYAEEFDDFRARAPLLLKPGGKVLAWTGEGGFVL